VKIEGCNQLVSQPRPLAEDFNPHDKDQWNSLSRSKPEQPSDSTIEREKNHWKLRTGGMRTVRTGEHEDRRNFAISNNRIDGFRDLEQKGPAKTRNLEQNDQKIPRSIAFKDQRKCVISNEACAFTIWEKNYQRILSISNETTSDFRNREQRDMESPNLKLSAPRRFNKL
jgi:hypothetical protein